MQVTGETKNKTGEQVKTPLSGGGDHVVGPPYGTKPPPEPGDGWKALLGTILAAAGLSAWVYTSYLVERHLGVRKYDAPGIALVILISLVLCTVLLLACIRVAPKYLAIAFNRRYVRLSKDDITRLARILADRRPTTNDIRKVMHEAGVKESDVDLDGPSWQAWQELLCVGESSKRLPELLIAIQRIANDDMAVSGALSGIDLSGVEPNSIAQRIVRVLGSFMIATPLIVFVSALAQSTVILSPVLLITMIAGIIALRLATHWRMIQWNTGQC